MAANPNHRPAIRGVIFDLDGTLVDSGLDFEQMRREMGLPTGQPLLEAIAALDEFKAERCREILARHEAAGADAARLMPGVAELMAMLAARQVRRAVLTRNSRVAAERTLKRLGLEFDPVVAREDAPAKPDPTAIWIICAAWELPLDAVAMVGDFHFDIEAGRRAGVRTVLYTQGRAPDELPWYTGAADLCVRCFHDAGELIAWLGASP
jgi:HAD superfamily hydrolase (TIGR01549 family)